MPAMDVQTLAWIINQRVTNADLANKNDDGGLRYTLTYAAFRPGSPEQSGEAVYQIRVEGYGDPYLKFPTTWRTYAGLDVARAVEDNNQTDALKSFASAVLGLSGTLDMFERILPEPLLS